MDRLLRMRSLKNRTNTKYELAVLTRLYTNTHRTDSAGGAREASTPTLKGPLSKSCDRSSGILHIVTTPTLGLLKKHFDQF